MKKASFSSTVKEELSEQPLPPDHCRLAELSAFFSFGIHPAGEEKDSVCLHIQTENETVARKCFTLIKKTINIDVRCSSDAVIRRGKNSEFEIELQDRGAFPVLLETLGFSAGEGTVGFNRQSAQACTQKNCCAKAYIRGAFLAAGSISDPGKGYHFEIVCPDMERAEFVGELMSRFGISARTVLRKKAFVLYVKDASMIGDVMAAMGANVGLMNFENIRILKDISNTVNRKVNCETANINKTVNASVKQLEDIRLVQKLMGFGRLSAGLAQMAELRLAYPEASLKELGMMSDPPVGKSGVNHRLRRLSAIAEDLRNGR